MDKEQEKELWLKFAIKAMSECNYEYSDYKYSEWSINVADIMTEAYKKRFEDDNA